MKQVLVIVGPTGIGKSGLGVQLAHRFSGEIISGDAIQVYKECNIGSAKLSLTQQEHIPHHLLDCYTMDKPYNVSLFQKEARQLIETITQRKKIAIGVGGNGLYIKALLYDYVLLQE